ncbi:hypothetical protein L0665_00800 [Methanogenium marinum]|uniref:Uncharacterized protein n=1 Tax=Methanogenium marinum TaxID=348610 RepID=A0A9Q4PY37_9EURY|nr:hypothetical protein [Methanogenium marinum]MDE4907167.1 hypothetical protein [Methanogenium marinum]
MDFLTLILLNNIFVLIIGFILLVIAKITGLLSFIGGLFVLYGLIILFIMVPCDIFGFGSGCWEFLGGDFISGIIYLAFGAGLGLVSDL